MRDNTLAWQLLAKHNASSSQDALQLHFDALASHDITYVGIIQTARASGLTSFPLPYVLTNCHNSLCAVGGTINEDDHLFGLSAARKYGGIFVPTNQAVIHQYVREQLCAVGRLILGSDSHTRYGALGVMGFGEGGPELVKQLLQKTYDIPRPQVICVWLKGTPPPSTGPQDVALALIQAVFKSGFVKNKVLEFHGPGVASLSLEFRSGLDVMTTETTCLSSIWETDAVVKDYYTLYGRSEAYQPLQLTQAACFDGLIEIDLSRVPSMIALPFHPSNAYPITEFLHNVQDHLADLEKTLKDQYGALGQSLKVSQKLRANNFYVDQGLIAGCAGGSYENIALAAQILDHKSTGNGPFSLSLYPASMPICLNLVQTGAYQKLIEAGCLLKSAFCGPCFGAGDTPAHGAFSIRHSTRNFPNREGSKPAQKQLSLVALMDARSIAATALNQGRLTPASDLDWDKIAKIQPLKPDLSSYKARVYQGVNHAEPATELILGPNITDWPCMQPLPDHLILHVVSVITDPVTTTDELIPSGETSSLRSNPLKLAEFTLSRKDPEYVGRAKAFKRLEEKRVQDSNAKAPLDYLNKLAAHLPRDSKLEAPFDLKHTGFGSTICAMKPGDGSAREQAASCQKVLGGWANLACDYATKRYRSNLINWGMLPLLIDEKDFAAVSLDADICLLNIREKIAAGVNNIQANIVSQDGLAKTITLRIADLTSTERQIILAGCLINFYQNH